MKHLLEALDGRLNVRATDADINHLLNDVRASKGPKSTDHFYETLDRVLNELKSTQEAVAFLRPVKKAEAPDYDQGEYLWSLDAAVVKHPMDLATVQKRIKTHHYQNKQQFAGDLNLIWDNCLLYNSDPNHHLRRHANFMREKSDYMLERITDVNERFQPANFRFKPPPAQHYSKSRTIESSDEDEDFPLKANGKHPNGAQTNGVIKANGHVPPIKATINGVKGHASKDDKRGSVLGKRKVDEIPFLDRPAIIRTPAGMASFRDVDMELQRYLESEGTGPSRQPVNSILHHELGSRVSSKLKTVIRRDDGDEEDPSTTPQQKSSISRIQSNHGERDQDSGASERASKNAMDVLTDVAADFIMNLGRTLRFYTDKYGQSMTSEEIILHTLFENGTMETQELERYIKEDVERYGSKIHDIEKKFAQTYQELTETNTIDDEELLEDSDRLMAGNWTEDLGEDFFGFRALGLDKELGLTSMSIPSKLFHGRGKQRGPAAAQGALSTEPPPPYPPPPPFLPVGHEEADAPPGLLQAFYRERFETLAATTPLNSAALPTPLPPNLPPPPPIPADVVPPALPSVVPSTLPDDAPDPYKMKSGPLGQITVLPSGAKPPKPPKEKGTGRSTGKKKKAGDEPPDAGGPNGIGGPTPSGPLQVLPPASQGQQIVAPSQQSALLPPVIQGNPPNPQPPRNDTPAAPTTPSPAKKKSKTPKKKPATNNGTGNGNTGGGGGAPQAGPIVMATA
ncbi:Transcriptional activator spt7 [Tulasnella sp. 332]|nr:Transcriptional activator spt7 [Tulasnella sp. 332]